MPEYKGKCKLDHDSLVIRINRYTIDNLDKLPNDLAPYKVAQRSSETSLVFHGEHTQLSNFYVSPFEIDRQKFTCTEQYIQYKKNRTMGP